MTADNSLEPWKDTRIFDGPGQLENVRRPKTVPSPACPSMQVMLDTSPPSGVYSL